MRISFRDADFDALASLWNSFYPARYRVDADLLRQNTVGCPLFDWGASTMQIENGQVVGFVAIKKSPSTLYWHPDKDQYHLASLAHRDPYIGVGLLEDAKRILIDRGATRLVFGQDSRHFFPGCPEDCRSLADFLMVNGFQASDQAHDLERDMTDYVNHASIPGGDEYRVLTEKDMSSLRMFFAREFPWRWRYDVLSKVEAEGPSCVYGLFRKGHVEGFALLQDWRHRVPIGGAVWRGDLGAQWGSLGPIGISQSIRGQGSGNALLGKALEELRDRGVRRAIIDWTGLVDFYGKHGFQVTRTYSSLTLPFE